MLDPWLERQDSSTRIHDLRSGPWIHYPGSQMLEPEPSIKDAGSQIQHPRSRILDSGFRILDRRSSNQDCRIRMQLPGSKILRSSSRIQDLALPIQGLGSWTLDRGCRTQDPDSQMRHPSPRIHMLNPACWIQDPGGRAKRLSVWKIPCFVQFEAADPGNQPGNHSNNHPNNHSGNHPGPGWLPRSR